MNVPDTWPDRDLMTFEQWFDYEIFESVFDRADDDIVAE